jgi:hypothetical protein
MTSTELCTELGWSLRSTPETALLVNRPAEHKKS